MADEDHSVENISGNAPEDAKAAILNFHRTSLIHSELFSQEIIGKLKIVSVDVNPLPMGKKKEVVVVCEIVVQQEMCNGFLMMHGGCTATILDIATSLPVPLLMDYADGWIFSGLTSSLSLNYFIPGGLGERLRIVCKTKAGSKRSATIVGEIWSSKGLVASATHVKMAPSGDLQPKL